MVPARELFEGLMYVRPILELVESNVKPADETGEVKVTAARKHAMVRQHLAQVFDGWRRRQGVKSGVVELEGTVPDHAEELP